MFPPYFGAALVIDWGRGGYRRSNKNDDYQS
jgi:hypothetical protein